MDLNNVIEALGNTSFDMALLKNELDQSPSPQAVIEKLWRLKVECEFEAEEPLTAAENTLLVAVAQTVTDKDDTETVYQKLVEQFVTRQSPEEVRALIWDIARILGLSDEQASRLACDPTPEEIEAQREEKRAKEKAEWARIRAEGDAKSAANRPPMPPEDWQKLDRKEQNRFLKAHGYKWVKWTEDEIEDMGYYDMRPGWYLYDVSGQYRREVSVERAFAEILRGKDTVAIEEAEKEYRKQQAAQHRREHKAAIGRVKDRIRTEGERPESVDSLEGEVLFDTRTIYGNGNAVLIEEGGQVVWFLYGNGMDGDNWSYNNMPGHIAYRLDGPAAQEVIIELNRLNSLE